MSPWAVLRLPSVRSVLSAASLLVFFLVVAASSPAVRPAAAGVSPEAAAPASAAQVYSYSLATTRGGLIGEGAALAAPAPAKLAAPAVGVSTTPDDEGAWLVAADGGIFTFGDASFYGSAGDIALAKPIVGMAATPDGKGYWLVASDGGIFSYGDASFYGSTGATRLNEPVVGMAATPDGKGYWLVASDGGIFSFGDASFHGSTGAMKLNKPIVGMAATPDGNGYWLVASDGGIFTFGDAPFYGSAASSGQQVVGMALEVGGYENPLRAIKDLTPERVDQGVDYAGSGPIYAIGDGVVLNTTNAGWPGGAFISYQLEDGRARGDIVYVAENVQPTVSIGQQVTPNTAVGTLVDAYPDLETGWAEAPGTGSTAASAAGQWSSYDDSHSVPTAFGENFSQLLASLGAPAGLTLGSVSGSVPSGWPTW